MGKNVTRTTLMESIAKYEQALRALWERKRRMNSIRLYLYAVFHPVKLVRALREQAAIRDELVAMLALVREVKHDGSGKDD